MPDLAFYAALALLITHELDAVRRHEWRILPVLRSLPDEAGFAWFTLLHVPLFVAFLWLIGSASPEARHVFEIALSAFAVAHAGLHWLLRKHPRYEFNNRLSWSLILGAAVAGGFYILLVSGQ
jgi:Na+/H+ antiporter NhaD/arsenite permease-like protein